jgi:outer membrane protein assembly factor BamD
MTRPHRALFAITFAAMFALSACGPPKPQAERDLYDEANGQFDATNFDTATSLYEELLEQYPFSDLAEVARLRIAHAYYLSANYEKAVAAFNDFERLHPTSAQLPFVEYTIGMSYLDQARTRDRDSSASESALRQFERVRDSYPETLWSRLAGFRIAQCKEKLAGHELYVGDYYAKIGKRKAARARFQYVLDTYPNSDAAVLARERLADADLTRSDDVKNDIPIEADIP